MTRGELVVGVDVGGTGIKALLVDGAGTVLDECRTPTPDATRPQEIVERVLDAVHGCVERLSGSAMAMSSTGPVAAVGLAVPGVVDEVRGVAVDSENLGWHDVPMRDMLADRVRLPIAFGHDVRVGGLAEVRIGAGQGFASSAFVPLGTGIAAALYLDGRPYAGHGYAGEIGHTDVGHGEACVCGATGCLEAIASAAAIARRYAAASGHPAAGSYDVLTRMQAGDAVAARVWNEAVDALGLALSWTASMLAPDAIILGGGLAEAGDALLRPLAEAIDKRLTFQPRPRLLRASLGDRAAALGSALLARELLDAQSPR